jgi:hypothetical protein
MHPQEINCIHRKAALLLTARYTTPVEQHLSRCTNRTDDGRRCGVRASLPRLIQIYICTPIHHDRLEVATRSNPTRPDSTSTNCSGYVPSTRGSDAGMKRREWCGSSIVGLLTHVPVRLVGRDRTRQVGPHRNRWRTATPEATSLSAPATCHEGRQRRDRIPLPAPSGPLLVAGAVVLLVAAALAVATPLASPSRRLWPP